MEDLHIMNRFDNLNQAISVGDIVLVPSNNWISYGYVTKFTPKFVQTTAGKVTDSQCVVVTDFLKEKDPETYRKLYTKYSTVAETAKTKQSEEQELWYNAGLVFFGNKIAEEDKSVSWYRRIKYSYTCESKVSLVLWPVINACRVDYDGRSFSTVLRDTDDYFFHELSGHTTFVEAFSNTGNKHWRTHSALNYHGEHTDVDISHKIPKTVGKSIIGEMRTDRPFIKEFDTKEDVIKFLNEKGISVS